MDRADMDGLPGPVGDRDQGWSPTRLSGAARRAQTRHRELMRADGAIAWPTAVFLGALFAFHAAASGLPGRAYFSLVGLNDISAPPGLNLLLQPSILLAGAYLMYCSLRRQTRSSLRVDAVTVGLGLWLVAATMSAMANVEKPQIILTYCAVFLAGGVVYATLSKIAVTETHVDVVVLSMMAGALIPALAGIAAYLNEWGIPDWKTLMNATLNQARMEPYEVATFGNRGNMAAFLMIVMPPVMWLALDARRRVALRLVCAAVLAALAFNLLIIEVRAAFITLVFISALVWRFRSRSHLSYAVFAAACGIVLTAAITKIPEVGETITERFSFLVTLDTGTDASLLGRANSMVEGIEIAKRNWAFGIGPGAALSEHSQTSAHQLHVQQGMETGALGFVGCAVATLATFTAVFSAMGRGRGPNRVRFALLIGPAAFLLYGLLANATLNIGPVNTWTVLVLALLALSRRHPAVPESGAHQRVIAEAAA